MHISVLSVQTFSVFHLAYLLKAALGAGHMSVFSCGEPVILVKKMSAQWKDTVEKAQYVSYECSLLQTIRHSSAARAKGQVGESEALIRELRKYFKL